MPGLNIVNYDFHDYKGDHMPVLYLVNYDFRYHKGLCLSLMIFRKRELRLSIIQR